MARRQEEECKGGLPAWMATYGDMVTLLLCFFVLLFSMSSVDVKKFKEAIASFNNQIDVLPGGEALTEGERINNGVSQMDNIEFIIDRALQIKKTESESDETEEEAMQDALQKAEELADDVDQYLQQQGVRQEVDLKYSLNFVKITLPGETLFNSGDARIREEAYPVISVIGDMIAGEEFSDFFIQIEGHTDNVPINTIYYPSNWELSAARAIAVGKYFIDSKGIDESKMSCTGYGEYNPIVPNDSAENRAKNRRVEVKIVLQTEEVHVEEYDFDENTIEEEIKLEDSDATEGSEVAVPSETE